MDILQIRGIEQGRVQVINMLGQQLYANALVTNIGKDLKYLSVVCHVIKKGR